MKNQRRGPPGDLGRRWPEGAYYRCPRGVHELILARRHVSQRLAAEVQGGEAEIALIVDGPWIVLGYRIGHSAAWGYTTPFNWHTMPEADQLLPDEPELSFDDDPHPHPGAELSIVLIEAKSGVAHARRAVALCPALSRALHNAIRSQIAEPFSGATADHELAWLNHKDACPADRALVRARCGPVPGPGAHRPDTARLGDPDPSPSARRGADRLQSTGSS